MLPNTNPLRLFRDGSPFSEADSDQPQRQQYCSFADQLQQPAGILQLVAAFEPGWSFPSHYLLAIPYRHQIKNV
jgi:hypothetical protein